MSSLRDICRAFARVGIGWMRLFADFIRWVADEIKTIRRDWLSYSLAIGGWRLMPWWCNRNRCYFGMWNDPDGNWTVKIGVFEHTDKDRAWATTVAASQYFDSANVPHHLSRTDGTKGCPAADVPAGRD